MRTVGIAAAAVKASAFGAAFDKFSGAAGLGAFDAGGKRFRVLAFRKAGTA